MSRGADPHRPSRDGKTPLQSAQEEGHAPVVAYLTGQPLATVAASMAPPAPTAGPAATPAPPSSSGAGGAGAMPSLASPAGPASPAAPSAYVAPAAPVLLPSEIAAASAPAGPPRIIGGLDFSRGVICEGELRKKRANKVMKWRKKYYVLSRTYGALFFWTGTRDRVGELHRQPDAVAAAAAQIDS